MSNKFRPIQGLEEKILAQPYNEGVVYFATDSGKIYMDARQESKILMGGGGINVLYSNETNVIEYGDLFQLGLSSLEDEKTNPKENDLIINSDGRFFKVFNIEGEVITCSLIAVSGTGGGGTGPGVAQGTATIERLDGAALDCLHGESCLIRYKFTAADSAGDVVGNGAATWYVGGVKKTTSIAKQGDNEFDIGQYLGKGDNNVKLSISVNTGGDSNVVVTKSWTVNAITLSLEWNYDDTDFNYIDEKFDIKWIATGNAPYKAHIKLGAFNEKITDTISQFGNLYTYSLPANIFTHGSHKIDLYLESEVNGKTLKTPTISYEAIFIDKVAVEAGTALPIVASSFNQGSMMQYDTVRIPIVIFDPNSTDNYISATLKENDTVVEEWNSENKDHLQGVRYYWNYTPSKDGMRSLRIICGATVKTIEIDVEKIDLGDVAEVDGYSFKLKASDFAGNDGLRSWSSNGITATFSDNFDWINGGIKNEVDEKGNTRQYIGIRNGTTMTINFNPFNENYVGEKGDGFCFKAIFKATGCRDYEAPVLSCYDGNYGLEINAQESKLHTNVTELSTQYCEDTYIELEVDAYPYEEHENTGRRYLIYWIDGVPAGIALYGTRDDINQGSTAVPITIGSADCDVQLYLVKFYPNHINDEGHLNNFIVDAPNAAEMISRFKRNDILDPNSKEISPQRLAAANPGVEVHMYDIPYMTTSKDDKVDCNSYLQYKGNGESPVLTGEGFKMRVQGTSSAAYGVAAYNFDTDYKKGKFYDAEGKESSKYYLDDQAIGIKYMNTKVNVASSEGANNAVNQEWYNRFQPYICKYRKKAESEGWERQPRDTMEFNPGIVFFLDRNKTIDNTETYNKNNVFKDTPGYTDNPYYKQYAIGCMGNSKKNTEVFHDETNPLEACVEVADNQQPQQWMTTYDYLDDYTEAPEGAEKKNFLDFYEFRYVQWENEEDEIPSMDWMLKWRRLVKWMADNDPSPYEATNHPHGYTGEALPAPVTFGNFTFSGKDGSTVLKGLTISKYAGTYTNDTYEYRMAKMLSECEDYLIMDAIVYHYLFIERHTMVDNVAKNTFWGTEDGVHWQLVKDYDNDTADGNDNEGKLTLHYGIECLDIKDPVKGTKYFNASESVWLNFIHGLYDARRKMFIDRENAGAWDADTYLAAFDEFQSVIPERCWIEDYYRKYLRPRELGLDSSQFYLKMLDGGKKTHQRKQFERYQEMYMASQYHLAGDQKDIITLRSDARSGALDNNHIKITPYADCYVRCNIGQQESISQRAKRGETYEIKFSSKFGDLNDATVYVYPGPLCSELLNLNVLNAKTLTLDNAPRLRTVEINNSDQPNEGLESLGFSSNPMLETIYAKNLTNHNIANTDLSLRTLKNLKFIDTTGSAFSSVAFADGGLIETAKLEAPKVLVMSNLSKLTNFSINNKTLLNDVSIVNCDIDSYGLMKDCLNNAQKMKYNLQGVDWKITTNNGDIVVKENATDSIVLLDHFLDPIKTQPLTDYKSSLTGKLTIESNVYNFNESIDIYQNYITKDKFANFDLIFNGTNAKLCKITLVDANGATTWINRVLKGSTLTAISFIGGPSGRFDGFEDYKDTVYTYTFKNGYEIYDASGENKINEVSGKVPLGITVNQDIIIKPKFEKKYNTFKVSFYNLHLDSNNLIQQREHPYGTVVADILPQNIPTKADNLLPLREVYGFKGYSTTPDGDVLTDNQLASLTITDERSFYAQFEVMDIEEYFTDEVMNQYYQIGKITTSYVESDFTPSTTGESYDIYAGEGDYADYDGLCYIDLMVGKKGKILIPNYIKQNDKKYLVIGLYRGFGSDVGYPLCILMTADEVAAGPIEGIKYYHTININGVFDFEELDVSDGFPVGEDIYKENPNKNFGTDLSHILFKNDSQVRVFEDECFRSDLNLEYVGDLNNEGLPQSLRWLKYEVFRNCSNLRLPIKDNVSLLAKNIYKISSITWPLSTYTFNSAFRETDTYQELRIPGSLQIADSYSFAYPNAKINTLVIGSEENPSQLDFSKTNLTVGTPTPFKFNADEVNKIVFYSANYVSFDDIVATVGARQYIVSDFFNNFANVDYRQIYNVSKGE